MEKRVNTKCLLGLAIGDALGEPYEGLTAERIREIETYEDLSLMQENPKITDDTILSILVSESIIEEQGVFSEAIGRKIISNEGGLERIGPTTRGAILMLKKNPKYISTTGTTNGAAMRASPIGLSCCEDIIEKTAESSSVTHGTDVAISGASFISSAIDAAVCGLEKDEIIEAAKRGAREGRVLGVKTDKPHIDELVEVAIDTPIEDLADVIGVGIETHESVPTAAALFYNSKDFKEAVLGAIKLGGDTDTIASMAGALSGAFFREVPDTWSEKIVEGRHLMTLEKRLLDIKWG
ncbi:MAG: ADP-ribosylglycohydrolase family protein [Halobacteriota archaeon]|nr:ADP-ribosylglycohydrolase family protein [Halobacteriota archaeon]